MCLLLSLSLFCTRFLQERVIHLSLSFSSNSSIFPPFLSSSLCSLGQWRRMRTEWRRKNKKSQRNNRPLSSARCLCGNCVLAQPGWYSTSHSPLLSLFLPCSHSLIQSRSALLIQNPPAITLSYHIAPLSRVALFFTQKRTGVGAGGWGKKHMHYFGVCWFRIDC